MALNLLGLCDELLLMIVQKLDSYTQTQLAQTCMRMNFFLCEKKLVQYVNFSGEFKLTPKDIRFFLSGSNIRPHNITALNIEGCYWLARSNLKKYILRLDNLKYLYTADTKLKLRDIIDITTKLERLTDLSLMCTESKNYFEGYEKCNIKRAFNRIQVLYVYFDECSTQPTQVYAKFLKIFKTCKPWPLQWCFGRCFVGYDRNIPLKEEWKVYKTIWNTTLAINKIFSYFIHNELQLTKMAYQQYLFDAVLKFLPGCLIERQAHHNLQNVFNVQTLKTLSNRPIVPSEVDSLNILFIMYNFDGKILGDAHRTIKSIKLRLTALYAKVCTCSSEENKRPLELVAEASPLLEIADIRELPDDQAYRNNFPGLIWYPDSLKHIAKWTYLKQLTLSRIDITKGDFLVSIAESCKKLTHIFLSYLGDTNMPCCYLMGLKRALPLCKNLQFINLRQPRIGPPSDFLRYLIECRYLEQAIINTSDYEGSYLTSKHNIQMFIDSCTNLVYLNIQDKSMKKQAAASLEKSISDEYKHCRPNLFVKFCNHEMFGFETQSTDVPMILRNTELKMLYDFDNIT